MVNYSAEYSNLGFHFLQAFRKQEKSAVQIELRISQRKVLERREVEKRIYGVKGNGSRLAVAFHDYRIKDKYDLNMTDSVRNCE